MRGDELVATVGKKVDEPGPAGAEAVFQIFPDAARHHGARAAGGDGDGQIAAAHERGDDGGGTVGVVGHVHLGAGSQRVQAHRGIDLGNIGGRDHQHGAIKITLGVRARAVLNHSGLGDERRKRRRYLGAHHAHPGAMGRQLCRALGCHGAAAHHHHQAVVKVEKDREERATHSSPPSSGAMPLRSRRREMAST